MTWTRPCNGRTARPTSSGTEATGGSTTSKFPPDFDFMNLSKSKFFRRFTIDSGDPPFPRDAQDWLFGCYESNKVQVRERQQGYNMDFLILFCLQLRVFPKESDNVEEHFGSQVIRSPGGGVGGATCH